RVVGCRNTPQLPYRGPFAQDSDNSVTPTEREGMGVRRLDHFEERLGQVPLFRACSKQDLRQIARLADADSVREGEALVREGQRGQELFIIVSGEAVVTRKGRRLATLRSGDYFGELAVLHPAPRTATVTALTPMEVLIVS